jgi:hypothetical protein
MFYLLVLRGSMVLLTPTGKWFSAVWGRPFSNLNPLVWAWQKCYFTGDMLLFVGGTNGTKYIGKDCEIPGEIASTRTQAYSDLGAGYSFQVTGRRGQETVLEGQQER